jgi:hypothetical protein
LADICRAGIDLAEIRDFREGELLGSVVDNV